MNKKVIVCTTQAADTAAVKLLIPSYIPQLVKLLGPDNDPQVQREAAAALATLAIDNPKNQLAISAKIAKPS